MNNHQPTYFNRIKINELIQKCSRLSEDSFQNFKFTKFYHQLFCRKFLNLINPFFNFIMQLFLKFIIDLFFLFNFFFFLKAEPF